ncbi:MAG: MmcQ/YjbR family DNA-binding protein [Thermomicrobiales bacterium]
MADETDAERIALALPETSSDPDGFRFFVKGKQFPWSYLERAEPKEPGVRRNDILAVRVADEDEKAFLLATDPGTFFTTAHYDGYPAILVRLPEITVDEFEAVLADAWPSRAPRRLVKEFDAMTGDRECGYIRHHSRNVAKCVATRYCPISDR